MITSTQGDKQMQTFTKTATFTGAESNLEMFLFSGISFESKKKIANNTLTVTWLCESENCDIHDNINLDEAELWNIELVEING